MASSSSVQVLVDVEANTNANEANVNVQPGYDAISRNEDTAVASTSSYVKQTSVESVRSRADSVESYTSGGSDEALLPKSNKNNSKISSPRRSATATGGRSASGSASATAASTSARASREQYEEIEETLNNFQGK